MTVVQISGGAAAGHDSSLGLDAIGAQRRGPGPCDLWHAVFYELTVAWMSMLNEAKNQARHEGRSFFFLASAWGL